MVKEKHSEQEKEHKPKQGFEKEIEELKATAEEYKDTLQRMQADWENFRKRNEREQDEFRKFSNISLLRNFLPLMDTISGAKKEAEKKENKEAIEALNAVEKQLTTTLEKNGVKAIESIGKKFDHNLHECLMAEHEDGKDDELVLEEFQKGYTYNDRVLRPAKVKVNKIGTE